MAFTLNYTGTEINNAINLAGLQTQVIEVTISASNWSSSKTNGWYTCQKTVSQMKAEYNPKYYVVHTSAASCEAEDEAFSLIKECETFSGYVIFRCLDKPAITLKVRFCGI